MKKQIGFIILLSAVLSLVGCKNTPVYNIEKAPITKNHSQDEIAKAIIKAGASLGWKMKDKAPGEITGILNLRKHMAKVKIEFNSRNYSINYIDSSNLSYDGENIHKNYNGWIRNLDNKIQFEIDYID